MVDSADCVLVNSPGALYSTHNLADPKIPLGLLYIASYLRSHGVTSRILDWHVHTYTLETLIQSIKDAQPYLVGLNISTPNRKVVYEMAESIKDEAKPPMLVIGGPHASCYPEDVLKQAPHADGVVIGEGEQVVLKLLEDRQVSGFPGFYTRTDMQNGISKQMAPRLSNLDCLPIPAYDTVDVSKYTAVSPELYVASSRGCKYDCVFCCSHVLLGHQVIFRDHKNVSREILHLKGQHNISSFYFYDDNFLVWPQLAEFCRANSPPSFQWAAQGNINDLRADIIPLLSSAGCTRLSFGFESGCPAVQKYIGKIIQPDAMEKIAKLRESGIHSRAFFIVGFPTETLLQIAETARYMITLRIAGLDDIAIFPARPFPGTRLLQECLSIYGDRTLEDLLEFRYVEDFLVEPNQWIRGKLHRYDAVPAFQINKYLDSFQVRKVIRTLYDIFYRYSWFMKMTTEELVTYLRIQTQER